MTYLKQVDSVHQDSTSTSFSLFLGQNRSDLTVLANVSLDAESINVETTGATPVVGNHIFLKEDVHWSQIEIKTVTPITGNQYTLGLFMPLDYAFTTAATSELQNTRMNVNGSVTPIHFGIKPQGLDVFALDVTRMIVTMQMTAAGDDGLFGNLPTLTNGVYFRTHDGIVKNLFNARENGEFAREGAGDVTYITRSGGSGSYGVRGRVTFNGHDKRGVVIRLLANSTDEFHGVVRDNLSTLSSFRIKIQGHVAID